MFTFFHSKLKLETVSPFRKASITLFSARLTSHHEFDISSYRRYPMTSTKPWNNVNSKKWTTQLSWVEFFLQLIITINICFNCRGFCFDVFLDFPQSSSKNWWWEQLCSVHDVENWVVEMQRGDEEEFNDLEGENYRRFSHCIYLICDEEDCKKDFFFLLNSLASIHSTVGRKCNITRTRWRNIFMFTSVFNLF